MTIALALLAVGAAPADAAAPDDQAVAYQGDAAHTGAALGTGVAPPLTQAWSVQTSARSFPLIANGRVFVLDTSSGGTLEAHVQATGALAWKQDMPGYWRGSTYDRGRLFLLRDGQMRAIDAATGTIAWTRSYPGDQTWVERPVARDGLVYYVAYHGDDDVVLWAVRERDGTAAWSRQLGHRASEPAVVGDVVVVTAGCGAAEAYDRVTGAQRWARAGCLDPAGQTPVIANGVIWGRDTQGATYRLALADGAMQGTFSSVLAPAVTPSRSFTVSGAAVSAGGPTGADGPAWTFTADGQIGPAPLAVENHVFVVTRLGKLSAISASSGTESWSAATGMNLDEGGLAAANGTLVVVGVGQMAAYRPSTTVRLPPTNTTLPSVDGRFHAGETLAADVGVWSGLPSSYSFQWQRCAGDGSGCAAIPGATGETYATQADDAGRSFRVAVSADGLLATRATSAPTPALLDLTPAPTVVHPPAIVGDPHRGAVLRVDTGEWTGDPTSFTYRWVSCAPSGDDCHEVGFQPLEPARQVEDAEIGRLIEVVVTAANDGGESAPVTTASVGPARGPVPFNDTDPIITGDATVGSTLGADPGVWEPDDIDFSYSWWRCSDADATDCTPVGTSSSYVLGDADLGRYVLLAVVASNANGDSDPAFAMAGPVAAAPPRSTTVTTTTFTPVRRPPRPAPSPRPPIVHQPRQKFSATSKRLRTDGILSFVEQTTAAGLFQGHAEATLRGTTRTIVYGDVSQSAAAGATRIRITPTKAALRLLQRGRLATIVAKVTFAPTAGFGTGRVQTLSFQAKRRR